MTNDAGLAELAAILAEALDAVPWLARVASGGAATARVRVHAQLGDGQLAFYVMDGDACIGDWLYDGLDGLRASPERMTAYAACLASVVAGSAVGDRLAELVPHPALLALAEVHTQADFDRLRLDGDADVRAVAALRAHS